MKCKLQLIGIHNMTDYLNLDSVESLQLLLSSCDLTRLRTTTIDSINLEIIFAHQIQRSEYNGNVIEEVCNVNADTYNEELDRNGNDNLIRLCLQVASVQQKSYPNRWTNAVMRKLTTAGINTPQELKYYIVHETLNPRLSAAGDSGLNPTTQKGFLKLIDGCEDFR